jgi:hypothetical protein
MAKKAKLPSPFAGRWRIVSMSAWEDDYLDEEVEAFVEFGEDDIGSFQFGYVSGQIDFRATQRDGKPAVEFSWDGGDGADGTPLSGRGWALLENDGLIGMFFIHLGDESEFVAKRKPQTLSKPKRKR